MDIFFQSGDFFNETNSVWTILTNNASALLGAVISGSIAIWIFRKGFKKEKENKRDEYIKESNDLEQYFFYNVDSLCFFIDKQIGEISHCSKRLKNWNNKDFALSIFPELTTKDIWTINQEKLFKIFVTNKEGEIKEKSSDFINVRNCLYNIDNFIISQHKLNNEIFQRLSSNIELWNHSLKTLLNLSNLFIIDYNLNPQKDKDEFLKLYTDLMVKKQSELIKENNSENMVIVFNELIKPLKKYLKENPNSNDNRILMISEPIINLQKAFFEIDNLRYERRKKILNTGRRLIKVKFILKNCISSTKKRKKIYR